MFFAIAAFLIPVQPEAQEVVYAKDLTFETLVSESLFHTALNTSPEKHLVLRDWMAYDREMKALLTGYISTRYPEWSYEVKSANRWMREDKKINGMIAQAIEDEHAMGLFEDEKELMAYAEQLGLGAKEKATLSFFTGYDYFKKKEFDKAERVFVKVIKQDSDKLDYALYYSGLCAMLQGRFETARLRLEKVRGPSTLRENLPYYIAGIMYGQKDYEGIIKRYGKGKYAHGGGRNGMSTILGLAYYQTGSWNEAIRELEQIQRKQPEIELLLATSYSRLKRYDKASDIYRKFMDKRGALGERVTYLYAQDAAAWGNTGLAIELFDGLVKTGGVHETDAAWNLSVLHGRMGNYRLAADLSTDLLNTSYRDQASRQLEYLLPKVKEDEQAFLDIVAGIKKNSGSLDVAIGTLFEKSREALGSSNYPKAEKYFSVIEGLDPGEEVLRTIAGWRGLAAYKNSNFSRAQKWLSQYLEYVSDLDEEGSLAFDAHYVMAYTCFKLKQHERALGYFSRTADFLEAGGPNKFGADPESVTEDVFVRMGDLYLILGDYEEATRCYSRAEDLHRYQKDHIYYHQALIAGLEQRPYDKIVLLDKVCAGFPNSPYAEKARFKKGEELFAIGKYDKAHREFSILLEQGASLDMKETAMLQMGLISTNKGDYEAAEKYYRQILDSTADAGRKTMAAKALREIYADYTFDTDGFLEVATMTEDESMSPLSKDSLLYALAQKHLREENLSVAFEQLQKIVDEYPGGRFAAPALLDQANILNRTGRPEMALGRFEQILQSNDTDFIADNDIREKYEVLLTDELMDYPRFMTYARDNQQRLSINGKMRWIKASIITRQFDDDTKILIGEIAQYDVPFEKLESLLYEASVHLMGNQHWAQTIEVLDIAWQRNEGMKVSPRLIYVKALALTNTSRYDTSVELITSSYTALLADAAWLAKSIILLSDNYVIQGDIMAAQAALEAMLQKEGKIPDSLIDLARNRLENLKLHIKHTESQKQHGDE